MILAGLILAIVAWPLIVARAWRWTARHDQDNAPGLTRPASTDERN